MRFILICVLAAVVSGCGVVKAGGVSAQQVPGPGGGVTCYAIMQDGQAVGGNCIRD